MMLRIAALATLVLSLDADEEHRRLAILSISNPTREQASSVASIERAAAVALCQAAKGYDCWRFATAPTDGQLSRMKVYGERQTGARFVRQLLGANIDAEIVSLEAQTRDLTPPQVPSPAPTHARKMAPRPKQVDELYARDFTKTFGWRHSCAPTFEQLHTADAATLQV